MKTASKVATTTTTPITNHQLVTTINELCEAAYVAEFLRGIFSREDGERIPFSAPEIYGLANVIGDLITRIEKAVSDLTELEGACDE